jgi:hypothetical protein
MLDTVCGFCKQGVRSSSLLSSTRQNTPTKTAGRGGRGDMPLPSRDQHAAQAIVVIIRPVLVVLLGGFDPLVERVSDHAVVCTQAAITPKSAMTMLAVTELRPISFEPARGQSRLRPGAEATS